MASNASTPRSRSSTGSSGSSDTAMLDAPPLTPARPRPSSHASHGALSTMTATAQTPDAAFPTHFFDLLRLPRELRDRIYAYVLVSPYPLWWPCPVSSKHDIAPNLLQVSRQVHDEAAPLLYSLNKFLFTHPSDCNIFRVVASPLAEQLTCVYLRIRERDVKLWTAYLGSTSKERSMQADLPRLRSLWIFLRCDVRNTPGMLGQLAILPVPPPPPPPMNMLNMANQAPGGGGAAAMQALQQLWTQQQQQQPHAPNPMSYLAQLGAALPPPAPVIHPAQANPTAAPQLPPLQPPIPLPTTNNDPTNTNNTQQAVQQLHAQIRAHAEAMAQAHGHPPPPPSPPLLTHTRTHAYTPHTFFSTFLRWERDLGLEPLCLSLQDTRPPGADVRIVCIMKLPTHEVARLVRLYPEELVLDRAVVEKGGYDARTRFRRVHGVEVSLEVSGFEGGNVGVGAGGGG